MAMLMAKTSEFQWGTVGRLSSVFSREMSK